MLTALGLVLLVGYLGFLWWFGPERITVAFVGWALATTPLLLSVWSRTRVRSLLAAALLLLLAFAASKVDPLYARLDTLPRLVGATAFFVASPVLITAAWVSSLHRAPGAMGSSARSAALPLLAFATSLVGGWYWAEGEFREPAEDPTAALSYAGCYEIQRGRWPASDMLDGGVEKVVPERLQLDTARGADSADSRGRYDMYETGKRLIRPGWGGSAYWTPLEGGRVRLLWTTGLAGVRMELRGQGNELRGRAVTFDDVFGLMPDPRVPVTAVRVPCGSVAPDSARAVTAELPSR